MPWHQPASGPLSAARSEAISVTEEVSEVAGVADVTVDLPSGKVFVTGRDVARDAVEAAVAEAGYEVIA